MKGKSTSLVVSFLNVQRPDVTLDYFLDMKNDVYGGLRFTLIVPLYFPYILFSASHLICPISILGYNSTTYKMVWASATTKY